MENHYPPVIEKSIKVIKRFEEKFGWFVIRVYQFPQVEGFGTFLESVQRTLLRHGTAGKCSLYGRRYYYCQSH